MRFRLPALLVALLALLAAAPAANAAPKKAFVYFSSTAYSVSESASTFNVTVRRSGNTRKSVTASVSDTGKGSAVAGTNYTFTPTTLTFAAGETTKTVPVQIIDNTVFEPNHTIQLGLSSASGQVKTTTTTITILEDDGPGTLDFSAPTYSVVENAGVATVTVNRNSSATNISESVDYATTALTAGSGHATAGVDYLTTTGTLTFAAGQMSKSFQVPVLDDSTYEGNETLDIALSNAKNLTNPAQPPNLGPNTPATLTIVDDDLATFAFSQPTYSVTEPTGSTTTKAITVTRGGDTSIPASVNYSDTGTGSATSGADYAAIAPGTISFAAGETSKTFNVTVNDDGIQEGNETIALQLTDVVSGKQLATATLSIVDDDNPSASVQFSDVAYSTAEGGTATVTVTLSKPVGSPVTVDYTTADEAQTASNNPATADVAPTLNDYAPSAGTLTFAAGQTSKTFSVQTHQDTEIEGDETLDVKLSNPGNAVVGAPSTAVVTIQDDDVAGSLAFDHLNYNADETDGVATITVQRVGGSSGATTVDYQTSDGTATAPGDYAPTSGTLSFADGESEKSFTVPVVWDGLGEGTETVNLTLSNPTGVSDLGDQTTAVLHIGDAGASGAVELTAPSYSVSEGAGAATITVARSGGSLGGPVSVDYATSDGTATAGADYTATSGTLTFAPGQAQTTIQVPVVNDTTREGDETFTVTLSNPQGGTSIGSLASAPVTIVDDDDPNAGPGSGGSENQPQPPAGDDASSTTDLQDSQPNPGPDPAGSQTAAADNVPAKATLKVALSARRLQRAIKAKAIVLSVRCSTTCALRVVAKVRRGRQAIALGKVSAKPAAGRSAKLAVRLSKKALARLTQSLRHNQAKVTLTLRATDVAGDRATGARAVTVRR